MTKYYIYHIIGKKIGCTKNLISRIGDQNAFQNYELLEMHLDIEIASMREKELQKEFGYKVDKIDYRAGINRTNQSEAPMVHRRSDYFKKPKSLAGRHPWTEETRLANEKRLMYKRLFK